MNIQEMDIMKYLKNNKFTNQRDISTITNHSIGIVNQSLKKLIDEEYFDSSYRLSKKALDLFLARKPKRAIILEAGFGMRMVPINMQVSKPL